LKNKPHKKAGVYWRNKYPIVNEKKEQKRQLRRKRHLIMYEFYFHGETEVSNQSVSEEKKINDCDRLIIKVNK